MQVRIVILYSQNSIGTHGEGKCQCKLIIISLISHNFTEISQLSIIPLFLEAAEHITESLDSDLRDLKILC